MSNYRYSLDKATLQQLQLYKTSDWKQIVNTVLSDMPIEANIDFSNSLKKTRLFELYDIINKYNLNSHYYEEAISHLLIECYNRRSSAERTYHLIQIVDYVQPSTFYPQLEMLLTSPRYDDMFSVQSPEGFSLSFHLLNALMVFDSSGSLFELLKTRQNENPPPEFYQLMIRYMYVHRKHDAFAEFMNDVFDRLTDPLIRQYVVMSIDEADFEKRSVAMVLNWLFPARKNLGKTNAALYGSLCQELLEWAVEEEERLRHHAAYHSLYAFLSSKVPNTLTKDVFDEVLKETSVSNKFGLLYYLGKKNPETRMEDKNGLIRVILPDGDPYIVTSMYNEEIDWFNRGVRYGIERDSREDSFGLSQDVLIKSEQLDAQNNG